MKLGLRAFLSTALVALTAAACGLGSDGSTVDETGTRGPGSIHSGWYKTPEAISQTITQTWELTLTPEEDASFLGGLRAALGGVSVASQGSLVDQPHELFVLATHSLSVTLGQKLVAKQIEKTAANEPYLFDGLGFAGDDDGCYADDAQNWCDGKDGLTVGSLARAGFDPNAPTKEQKKRLMHKMQSIGEFFLMAIDERTRMPGADTHAPQFLVDEVFLPALRDSMSGAEPQALAQAEEIAWREVVATILMSGWFFDLPAEE